MKEYVTPDFNPPKTPKELQFVHVFLSENTDHLRVILQLTQVFFFFFPLTRKIEDKFL